MIPSDKVVIVGGGVIGCSIAYHLSSKGIKVTLIERRRISSGASGVAAGMIASLSEGFSDSQGFKKDTGNLLELAIESRRLLLDSLERLQKESGIDVEYRSPGILHVAYNEADRDELHRRLEWQKHLNMGVEWLTPEQSIRLEPNLRRDLFGSLFSPNEGHVNSRRLVKAYAEAAIDNGSEIIENTEVIGLLYSNGIVSGVKLPHQDIQADWVVVASGSWSQRLSDWIGIDVPVKPIRGQVLAARIVPSPIKHILWHGINWMLPKADGSIIMGTTREDVGFDDLPNLGGISGILNECVKLIPEMSNAHLHKIWAGLRPVTPDEAPIIGPVEHFDGLLLALGHYRSGILLSTVTGKLIMDFIVSGTDTQIKDFNVGRFNNLIA